MAYARGGRGHDCFVSFSHLFFYSEPKAADRSSVRDNICNFSSFVCIFVCWAQMALHAHTTNLCLRLPKISLFPTQTAKARHVFFVRSPFPSLSLSAFMWYECGSVWLSQKREENPKKNANENVLASFEAFEMGPNFALKCLSKNLRAPCCWLPSSRPVAECTILRFCCLLASHFSRWLLLSNDYLDCNNVCVQILKQHRFGAYNREIINR